MYRRNAQSWLKHLDFILLDVIALELGFILAILVRFGFKISYQIDLYRNLSLALAAVDFLVSVIFNTMHSVLRRGLYEEFVQSLKQAALVLAVMSLYMFSFKLGDSYSRITIYLTAVFHLILGYSTRMLWKRVILANNKKHRRSSMVLVTDESHAKEIIQKCNAEENFLFSGIILSNRDGSGEKIMDIPVVAGLENAADYICRKWVDEVFFYPNHLYYIEISEENLEGDSSPMAQLIDQCRQMALPIHIRLPLENIGGKSFVEKVGGYTVLTTTRNYATPLQFAIKRLIDIIGGLLGSIAALLVMLIVGPMIKRESPGPILFKQTRIGQNGRRFQIYKIRSMYLDAEERKAELQTQNRVSDGMMFKMDFDPRIIGNKIVDGKQVTGIGEFIRSTSLDEFPQFFNVLLNQMSIVGTRPPTEDEWEKYKYHHRARLAMKPGITGMWQVSGRSRITDFEEVVKLDTEYINNWSLGLDFKIMAKTISAVLKKDGAQ